MNNAHAKALAHATIARECVERIQGKLVTAAMPVTADSQLNAAKGALAEVKTLKKAADEVDKATTRLIRKLEGEDDGE